MTETIQLKYCPRVGHSGNTLESLQYPIKTCTFRKWNKDWHKFECLPQPCTHRYCKANHIDYSLDAKFVCTMNKIPYGVKTEIKEFKIKHNQDFTIELDKATRIAEYAIKHGGGSSKDVTYIGLNSRLAAAILSNYGNYGNYNNTESEVPLIVYSGIIRFEKFKKIFKIASLKLTLCYDGIVDVDFYKVYKIIVDKEWATVLVVVAADKDGE